MHTVTQRNERSTGSPPTSHHGSRMRVEVSALSRLVENLLVLFKLGEYCFEFRTLFWRDSRKRDPKTTAVNPTHCGFVDPQWPIEAWNVKSAFELRTLLDLHVTFDF